MSESSPPPDLSKPPRPAPVAGRLFPDAYRRHRQGGPAALLPPTRRWLIAVVIVAATLVVLSAPLWLEATDMARRTVEQILSSPGG